MSLTCLARTLMVVWILVGVVMGALSIVRVVHEFNPPPINVYHCDSAGCEMGGAS